MDSLPDLSMSRVHRMDRTIARIALPHGLFAVSCTDTHRTTVAHNGAAHEAFEGATREAILTGDRIDQLLAGEDVMGSSPYFLFPTAALPLVGTHRYADMEKLRHEGPHALQRVDLYAHRGQASAHHQAMLHGVHMTGKAPYSLIARQGIEGITVLEDTGVSYLDAGKRLVPSLFEAGYIDGGFDNSRYDLRVAAAHLLAHPDVEVFPRRFGGPKERLAQTPEEAIHPIESYNARNNRDKALVFLWSPTGKARERLVSWFFENPSQMSMDMWAFVFEEDLLGLRACGASFFDDPHQTR